jgi:hypothetical protein
VVQAANKGISPERSVRFGGGGRLGSMKKAIVVLMVVAVLICRCL